MCFQILCLLLLSASQLKAQDPSCCQHAADFSPCKEACDQLATIKSESRLKHLLQRLPSYCPEPMNELWACINSTLPGVSRQTEGWVGLGCCELAISSECRRECKQASSKSDITKVCRKDTENSLYSCITKNEVGSTCCGFAGRHTTCREYCQAIFRTDSTPTVSQISAVTEYCQSHSPQLIGCVGNFTKSYPIRSPIDSLHCCSRAEAPHCQAACGRILRSLSTEHEIMEALITESPRRSPPRHPSKMDCAKLHCCSKANTSLCRDMCERISTNWGSQTWQDFDQLCEYNPVEKPLITCLSDVREPCQLGCKHLSYCSNFNNRPTELFRSCNVQSDQGAMNDMKLWSNGTIKMPFMNIPVLDIRKCLPDMWKAVACSLQIKPCLSKARGSLICKADCVEILTRCGDRKRFYEGQTPERICDLLSPTEDPERCIPLHKYLSPSPLGSSEMEEVVHPCNPNPCPSSHLCQVNRRGCLDHSCLPHLCLPGCKLGEASEFLVLQDSRVLVPLLSGSSGCLQVCSCGVSGRLENCEEMPCEETMRSCSTAGGQRSHGSSYSINCRSCFCFSGEMICSRKPCLTPHSSEDERRLFTGLPCSCGHQFVPVCASNGRTYPSACVARCLGFTDQNFQFGHCRLSDPCRGKPCSRSLRCVPRYAVCLSLSSECPQYECVARPSCDRSIVQPACDTNGLVHSSTCTLLHAGKTLAYLGPCQDWCRRPAPVCGQNGETYSTVCEAFNDRVAVDYQGSCHAVGPVSEGACCPICAAMLQILLNQEQINTFAKLNGSPVTVRGVLQVLRPLVSVPQCDVFGFLSIDKTLVVIIAPTEREPTSIQIEACNKEAEKIDSLINYASPTLISYVPLSAFQSSEVSTSSTYSSGGAPSCPLPPVLLLLLGLLIAVLEPHSVSALLMGAGDEVDHEGRVTRLSSKTKTWGPFTPCGVHKLSIL
ncbi:hypothetical protein CesoFtcFv8_025106 [Champsocephalus esox]|uniref:Reversion-inducing cysteine-rich protein with Kazal motifs n=1 Tax=Champsocephalus esox TaxID=159716 RepID=A0AAN8B353_9TELE|nr:hypothetical protein CesoFtcFv8_025106 [Champsocephalus esox]